MNYSLSGHAMRTAVEEIWITLFPHDRPVCVPCEALQSNEDHVAPYLHSSLKLTEKTAIARAEITIGGQRSEGVCRIALAAGGQEAKHQCSYAVREAVYRAARAFLPARPAWGSITGVRPVKLTASVLQRTGSDAETDRFLEKTYHVTAQRRKLALTCAEKALKAQKVLRPRDICLYAAIPFCPSRCRYCSFVSHSIDRAAKLVEPFIETLLLEIKWIAEAVKQNDLTVRTVYIGGGTPTVLSAAQLLQVLSAIRRAFDLSACVEYTVEAGRPDTIDLEKLTVLRENGADRVSVNPQSMNREVLSAAGRPHTPDETLRACHDVRRLGFKTLNMDLIAGMDCDTPESFAHTMAAVLAVRPENVTIHTLAYKKGAAIKQWANRFYDPAIGKMLKTGYRRLEQAGYSPYYLYRQKYMAGGFENTGWSLPGHDCLYNNAMMEEFSTVLALGAGGISKLVDGETGEVRRIFNPKFPYEYNTAHEKLALKNELIKMFYHR